MGGDGGDGGGGSQVGWPLKLGVLAPLSGDLETFGPEIRDTAKLAKKQVKAGSGFSVDLTVKDTESDPATAAAAAKELADDGYQAIVGPGSSESFVKVAQDVLLDESIVASSPLAAAPEAITFDDDGLMFTTCPRAVTLGQAMARPMSLDGIKTAAVIRSENHYGNSLAEEVKVAVKTRGIEVSKDVTISETGKDSYTSIVEQAMESDPGSLVVATGPVTGTQVLKDYYKDFGEQQVYLPDRLRLPDLPSQVASDMTSARVVALKPLWSRAKFGGGGGDGGGNASNESGGNQSDGAAGGDDPDAPILTQFYDAFVEEYDRAPTVQAAQAFDSTAVLLLATAAAGQDSYDGAEIKQQVRNVSNVQSGYSGVRTYAAEDYWEGLKGISEGLRNNYSGPTGQVEFDRDNGYLIELLLNALKFAPDEDSGFEEILPIPTK
jgi:ABC-type branched-subunit amino acid transport system substrate-binding protein